MKVSLVGVAGVPLGKHKVKDPRLDEFVSLIEARILDFVLPERDACDTD